MPRALRLAQTTARRIAVIWTIALWAAVPFVALVALVPAAAAHARVFPGLVLDGPSADVVGSADVDVARDGTGAAVWVRRTGGVEHVIASRLVRGAFFPLEQVDLAFPGAASAPVVSATDDGRIAVAFVSAGAVHATLRPAGARSFPRPVALGPGTEPALDMGRNGGAWVTWNAGGDVRAARLDRAAPTFAPALPAPLDADPAATVARPRVATAADGTALAAWTETGADGIAHVRARRLLDAGPSAIVHDLGVTALGALPGGGADLPDVRIEDDASFAWVSFRQVLGGVPRALARRLVGSAFDPPALVDGLGLAANDGVDAADLDLGGTGVGLAASALAAANGVVAAPLEGDRFGRRLARLDVGPNVVDPRPVAIAAAGEDGAVAWLASAGPAEPVSARIRPYVARRGFGPEARLTTPLLGAVDASAGLVAAASRENDVAALVAQGTGPARRIVAGLLDQPPRRVFTFTRTLRPGGTFAWGGGADLWGGTRYTVEVDGRALGSTRRLALSPPRRIRPGLHRWRVVARDRRGQATASPTRPLRVPRRPRR